MKCTDILNHLEDFLDAELSELLKKEVETHLNDCPACQSQFQSLKRLSTLLHHLPQPNPPQNLEALILEKIQQRNSFRPFAWRTPLLAAAGIFLSLTFLSTQFFSVTSPNQARGDSNNLTISKKTQASPSKSAQRGLEAPASEEVFITNTTSEKKSDFKQAGSSENLRNKDAAPANARENEKTLSRDQEEAQKRSFSETSGSGGTSIQMSQAEQTESGDAKETKPSETKIHADYNDVESEEEAVSATNSSVEDAVLEEILEKEALGESKAKNQEGKKEEILPGKKEKELLTKILTVQFQGSSEELQGYLQPFQAKLVQQQGLLWVSIPEEHLKSLFEKLQTRKSSSLETLLIEEETPTMSILTLHLSPISPSFPPEDSSSSDPSSSNKK